MNGFQDAEPRIGRRRPVPGDHAAVAHIAAIFENLSYCCPGSNYSGIATGGISAPL